MHVREKQYFVDEQCVGQITMWHNEHKIEPVDGGVLRNGIKFYKPPFRILGSFTNTFFI